MTSYQIHLEKRVVKTIEGYPPKHQRQVKEKILSLQLNPLPHDSKALVNFTPYYRCDIGEYRIVYRFYESTIFVILVGKRNGNEVFKELKRLL